LRSVLRCHRLLKAGDLLADDLEARSHDLDLRRIGFDVAAFGRRDVLLREAHRRIEQHPGKYFESRVYGEKEAGGTQVLYLSAVNFDLLGLPHLSATEHPTNWLRWQERVTKYFLLPISIYGVMVAFLKQNFREHEAEIDEEQKKTGLIPQL